MKEKKSIIYTGIILLGFILLFTGCNGRAIINNNSAMYTEKNMQYFGSEKKNIEAIKEIEVTSLYGNIEIIASDDYYIEYQFYYIDNQPELSLENGKLYFDDSRIYEAGYSISISEEIYMKIYVPNTADFEEVNLTTSSGNMSLGSFVTNQLLVSNSYGNVVISDIDSNETKIDMSSGNLTLENSNIDKLDVDNQYGEIKLSAINYKSTEENDTVDDMGNIAIKVSSGSVKMTDIYSENIGIDNRYGNVFMEGIFVQSMEVEQSSGNFDLSNCKVDSLDVNVEYGNINIMMNGNSENYVMNVKSEYGNTKIDNKEYSGDIVIDKGGEQIINVEAISGNISMEFKD